MSLKQQTEAHLISSDDTSFQSVDHTDADVGRSLMTEVLEAAFASALAQYEETMGEPFPTEPRLEPVDEEAFWAEVQWLNQELTVLVTSGLVAQTSRLWDEALSDPSFTANADATTEDMTYLSLIWLVLHELHHYQMGHFEVSGRYRLTESKDPNSFYVAARSSVTRPPALVDIEAADLIKVEPCLELQADHDAIEMLLDAYSPDGWSLIRMRTAAISAMMVLIEREDSKRGHEFSSHPKAATRIFQLLGHVIQMPMIEAMQAERHPELNINPHVPSDAERSAFNCDVVIPTFFDAVKLAAIADATKITQDLGSSDTFFQDVQLALLEPARKEVERYQAFVILRLCREDGGTRCLGMIPLAVSIDGTASAIQAI